LTIDEAVNLAVTRNERAAIADLDLVVAHAQVSKARVAFMPVLDMQASDTLRWKQDPRNVGQASIGVDQPLIEPTAFPKLRQAKYQLAGQRAQTADDKRRLSFDAARAFIDVLLAQQLALAARQRLDTAKANLADTDAHVKAQLVSSNDVTRAQISLAGAQRDLESQEGKMRSAYVRLAFVINSRVDETRGLAPPATLLAGGLAHQQLDESMVTASLARRPDLVARKQDALAAHAFAREPRMAYLPTLGLGAQVSGTTNNRPGENGIDAQVAVTARWTIFDGGTRSADIRIRDANAAIADLQIQQLARTVDADVRAAAAELAAAQKGLNAARDSRDAARKSASEVAILYRQQLAKAIELIDANEARFLAESNFASAEFAVANAYLALRLAMGLNPVGK
jgi:outer membrane protein TolC